MHTSVNDWKRLSIENTQLLNQVVINTVQAGEGGEETPKPADNSSKINQLETILDQKNTKIKQYMSVLQLIKDNISNQKGSSATITIPADELLNTINSLF